MDMDRDESKEQQIMDIIGEDDGSQYLNLSAGDEENQVDEEGRTTGAEEEEGLTNSDDEEALNLGSIIARSSQVYYMYHDKVNNNVFASTQLHIY